MNNSPNQLANLKKGSNRIDLSGKSFGSWTVAAFSHTDDRGQTHWRCQCKCGSEAVVLGANLRSGKSEQCKDCRDKSNGDLCRKYDPQRRYLFTTWQGIKNRCYNESSSVYRWYGGIGIGMFEPWRWNFQMFQTWVLINLGDRPSTRHSLDRIDGTKGYEPGNLRWATGREQANNLSSNRRLYFRGETLTLSMMAEKYGFYPALVQTRLSHGWTVEEALTKPIGYRHKRGWKGDQLFRAHYL